MRKNKCFIRGDGGFVPVKKEGRWKSAT